MRKVVSAACVILLIVGASSACPAKTADESQGSEESMSHEQKMVSKAIEIVGSVKNKIDEMSLKIDEYLRTFIEKYDSVRPEISDIRVRVVEKIEKIRAELGKDDLSSLSED